MSWIFTPLTALTSHTKIAPIQQKINFIAGRLSEVRIFLPASTTNHLVGVRINSPRGLIFPTLAEGSDGWVYSSTRALDLSFELAQNFGEVEPDTLTVEGFNTDAATQLIQVGIFVEHEHRREEKALNDMLRILQAANKVSAMPEVQKQLQLLYRAVIVGGENYD